MFLGKKVIMLSDLLDQIAPELYNDAKDYVKSSQLKHLKMDARTHMVSGRDFQAQLRVDQEELQEWACNCLDFQKTHTCVHVVAAVMVMHEQDYQKKVLQRKSRSLFSNELESLESDHVRFILKKYVLKDNLLSQITTVIALLTDPYPATPTALRSYLTSHFNPQKTRQDHKNTPKTTEQHRNSS